MLIVADVRTYARHRYLFQHLSRAYTMFLEDSLPGTGILKRRDCGTQNYLRSGIREENIRQCVEKVERGVRGIEILREYKKRECWAN